MNVLILTPDAVGSTLLQRLLTIYMQFHQYDRPVINLHELTNGLVKYYSPDFNRELLGKPHTNGWGYHQSLKEIAEILSSVDHYKTSRLAQYHLRNRQDLMSDQIPFYRYLNENFYIISCRRDNVFEHAISWALNKVTKKLNVYSVEEKISTFYNLYKDRVEVDVKSFITSLKDYKSYLQWSEDHFSIASYFEYEKHLPNMERYILNLPMFTGQNKLGWNDVYGMEFTDWNRCHYYHSNIGSIAMNKQDIKLLENKTDSTDLVNYLPPEQTAFVKQHLENYYKTNTSIQRMQELGIIVSSVPIKKQTLAEKRFMIKNFDQCLDIYNEWIAKNPTVGRVVDTDTLNVMMDQEQSVWQPSSLSAITVV